MKNLAPISKGFILDKVNGRLMLNLTTIHRAFNVYEKAGLYFVDLNPAFDFMIKRISFQALILDYRILIR